jgi:hypothetical protein
MTTIIGSHRTGPAISADARAPLIEVRDLVKYFGPVRALAGVSMTVNAGEVHSSPTPRISRL